jgi:LmbE family N-acetylglucosaminyl deacetylase
MPKALAIFAHPDDETIALGARLNRFQNAHLVHVTDGAPQNPQEARTHGFASRDAYRSARAQELEHALHLAGLDTVSRECLGIQDQEASLHLVRLAQCITYLLRKHMPEVVFTHPYEGGHPDHDACAFAVAHAVAAQKKRCEPVPLIVECAFYHAGPHGIATGTFLPQTFVLDEIMCPLTERERENKEALLACFASQQSTLRYFTLDAERFRIAPEHDFTKPPHPGPVFYDQFPWGMTSSHFCDLAQRATEALENVESTVACV